MIDMNEVSMTNFNIFSKRYKAQFAKMGKWGIREDLYELMEEKNKNITTRDDDTAIISFVYEDGEIIKGQSQICHQQLCEANDDHENDSELLYIQNFFLEPHDCIDDEVQLRYINWVVNESPYKDAFVIKDPKEIYNNYYLLRTDIPANMLVGACVVGRLSWEDHSGNGINNEDFLNVWWHIVKNGGDPNLAFVFAHLFRGKTHNGELFPVICMANKDAHHVCTFSKAKFSKIRNFVFDEKKNLERNFNEVKSYKRIENLWETDNHDKWDGDYSSEFVNFLMKLEPKSKVETINYNIFKPKDMYSVTGKSYQITNEEDLMEIFRQVEEKIHE
jgi:hypothetical protein